jgi:hypothetical protein
MIKIANILRIIRTEAFEYDGIPEVPDHKHGDRQNNFAQTREARGKLTQNKRTHPASSSALQYDIELIEDEDGTLRWHE